MLPEHFRLSCSNLSGAAISQLSAIVRPWKFDKNGEVVWGDNIVVTWSSPPTDGEEYKASSTKFDNRDTKYVGAWIEWNISTTGTLAVKLFLEGSRDGTTWPTQNQRLLSVSRTTVVQRRMFFEI
jgi:hypothetical protein